MTLADKLHPELFTEMSGRMAAIVGYILGEDWAEPRDRRAVGDVGWVRSHRDRLPRRRSRSIGRPIADG